MHSIYTKILIITCISLLMGIEGIFVFAAGTTTTTSVSEDIYIGLKHIIQFLSRGWIVPATIAGKLMTNDLIYFKAIHLDVFLWRIRNIMRSFANYAVGLLFLGHIIKAMISTELGVSKLFEIVQKLVIGVIGINISRFAIAVCIDMSIIGAAAAGSLPQSVMQELWPKIEQDIIMPGKYILDRDKNDKGYLRPDTTVPEKKFKLTDILPSANSVSGPLIFLGATVFRFFESDRIDLNANADRSNITLSIIIQIFVIFIFIVPILVLIVINMMRIFWIWIWIILSPLIILDYSFQIGIKEKATSASGTAGKLFEPSAFIGMVMQPVLTIASLSIMLMFLLGIHSMLTGSSPETLKTASDTLCMNLDATQQLNIGCGASETVLVGKLVSNTAKEVGSLGVNILISLLCSFLLWKLVKISFEFNDILASTASSIYGFAESAIAAAPIIPSPGGGRSGIGAASRAAEDAMSRGRQFLGSGNNNAAADSVISDIYGALGLSTPHRDFTTTAKGNISRSYNSITSAATAPRGLNTLKQEIDANGQKEFRHIKPIVDQWLANSNTQQWLTAREQRNLGISTTDVSTPESLYQNENFVRFLDAVLRTGDIPAAVSNARIGQRVDINRQVYGTAQVSE